MKKNFALHVLRRKNKIQLQARAVGYSITDF